ncbi:VOC family protein [Microbacterium kribbense]|uniref:VOC family protein n=1 Tax=Microbacterium kribbense TaxID=433645 RepID=A0ABP7GIQ5_9MICO
MGIPTLLDHVVIAGPSLDGLVAWFAERTGVTAAPGGRHPTGTANALVALTVDGARGRQYIELLGPAPDAETTPALFGIDTLTGPAIVTYAVHPDDLDATIAAARAAGADPGEAAALSRRTPDGTVLAWRLTQPRQDGVPFLIDWQDTAHPGLGELPAVELMSFTRTQPAADRARGAIAALGLPASATAPVASGPNAGYALTLRTASGTVTL